MFSDAKMSEAEVSVRLALFLLRSRLVIGEVDVAIDGAQIQTGDTLHFALENFLVASGCRSHTGQGWQGRYEVADCDFGIRIHSTPGQGDVVARLKTGRTIRAECKKGPLLRSKSSQEYPILREAVGQLMTVDRVDSTDILVVAAPQSTKFDELTTRWQNAPLIRQLGIQFATIDRCGGVSGLNLAAV